MGADALYRRVRAVCYFKAMVRLGLRCAVAALVLVGCKKGDPKAAADGTIVTPYLAIGDVLASDEVDNLSELAAAVVQGADGKTGPGLDAIIQGAGRVPAQDIATARTGFRTMSRGVIEYMRADAAKQNGHTIVHCTMTFSGDGAAWVQKAGDVMNPYEGAMMLHCGDKIAWDAEVPTF